eukprot:SAG31_NODE_1714_length_7462_cov_29.616596_5_plen_299_part_00
MILGGIFLFVLMFQPVAEGSTLVSQAASVSKTADQRPNLDLSQLAQLDIDPVLLQFIGNVVTELKEVKNELHLVKDELYEVKDDYVVLHNRTKVLETENAALQRKAHILEDMVVHANDALENRTTIMMADLQNQMTGLQFNQTPVDTPAIGRRSVQVSAEDSCVAADLYFRSQTVTAECCDEDGEDCSAGYPHSCNVGCAHVLIPFFTECSALLGPAAESFNTTVIQCQQVMEDEQQVEQCNGHNLTTMLSACCEGEYLQQGNGHRRELQLVEGCDNLGPECSALCAPIFIRYFYWDR